MSDSEASSDELSLSPPASPEASLRHDPPSLQHIVDHFVSAKRSLASTAHIYRAHELVTNSRALIEEIAVLNACNAFARKTANQQVETLQVLKDGMEAVGDDAAAEFAATITSLDEANNRLQSTLDKLRDTIVDASLRQNTKRTPQLEESQTDPSHDSQTATSEDQSTKTLYDFIDETRHEDITTSVRALIDSFETAQSELKDTTLQLQEWTLTVLDTLEQFEPEDGSGPQSKRTIYDEPEPTVPQLFHSMETYAAEMATALESLVRHYDLCVSALKHTEGGGEAAKMAVQQQDLSKNNSTEAGNQEESLYRHVTADPINEDERLEMLRVLETDAAQVEDVVAEIRDHAEELSTAFDHISKHASSARRTHKLLRLSVEHFHNIQASLPICITACDTFRATWSSIRADITTRAEELDGLTAFYEGFLRSYAALLREVERRRAAEQQMRRVAARAQKELDKLYEVDREAREDFVREVRMMLPGDIWPDAWEPGGRWVVREVDVEGEE